MTDAERLTLIEANSYLYPTSVAELRWLIAEVRRLQGEYARGLAEIAEFCKDRESNLITMYGRFIHDPISKLRVESAVEVYRYVISAIERGEHVEGSE